jgi:hypothetical protein
VSAEKRERARELATAALSELLDPDSLIEPVIQKAMRVAALCGHPYYRAWFQLQLADLTEGRGDATEIKKMLDAAFPDERMSPEIAQRVCIDYTASRELGDPDKVQGASITVIEQFVRMADGFLEEGSDPGPKILERVQNSRQILQSVRHRIRQYLTTIEGDGSTAPSDLFQE